MSFTVDGPPSFSFAFESPTGSKPSVRRPLLSWAERSASVSRDHLLTLVAEDSKRGMPQRRMRFASLLAPVPETPEQQSRTTRFLLHELRARFAAQISTLQALGALLDQARAAVHNLRKPGAFFYEPSPRADASEGGPSTVQSGAEQRAAVSTAPRLEGMLKMAHETLLQQYAILLPEGRGEATAPGDASGAAGSAAGRWKKGSLRFQQDFLALVPALRSLHARVVALVVAGARQQFQEAWTQLEKLREAGGRGGEKIKAEGSFLLQQYESQLEHSLQAFLVRNVSLGVLLCHFDHLHHQMQARWPQTRPFPGRCSASLPTPDACCQAACFRLHFPSTLSIPLHAVPPGFPHAESPGGPRGSTKVRFAHTSAALESRDTAALGDWEGGCGTEEDALGGSLPQVIGVMDRRCQPAAQLRAAIQQAQSLCRGVAGTAPPVRVFTLEAAPHGGGEVSQALRGSAASPPQFPAETKSLVQPVAAHVVFPSPILRYVLAELLKNAMQATLQKREDDEDASARERSVRFGREETPVDCVLMPVPGGMWIRISDRGVGIREDKKRGIFNCLNKDGQAMKDAATLFMGGETGRRSFVASDTEAETAAATALRASTGEGDTLQKRLEGVRVSGCGVGLLLSRAYMQYFGGELVLRSAPGKGTDCFLFVPSLETRSENLPSTAVPAVWAGKAHKESAEGQSGEGRKQDIVGKSHREDGDSTIPEELLVIDDAAGGARS
uniref:Protein-serine/threonine kinase n=2 Tax=Neospora caninum (strain Liverpool) TaxID=572307 RepID=A0A0F7UIJ2_NEOCL|nr:TPA: pyruvate dehydrogenase kinase, putative [Neospora caninum Liverpool]